jgi:hypothetical protein
MPHPGRNEDGHPGMNGLPFSGELQKARTFEEIIRLRVLAVVLSVAKVLALDCCVLCANHLEK